MSQPRPPHPPLHPSPSHNPWTFHPLIFPNFLPLTPPPNNPASAPSSMPPG